MADEPEDVEESRLNPPDPRSTARNARAYSLFLEALREQIPQVGDKAETVLILVLCSLKQRLAQEGVEDLRAPLPVRIHEALQACDARHARTLSTRDPETLHQRVAEALDGDLALAESTVRRVLATLRASLTEGEAEQVGEALDMGLRVLWARPI